MSPRAGRHNGGQAAVLAAVRALWDEHRRGVTRAEVLERVRADGRAMSEWTVQTHLRRLVASGEVRPPESRRGGHTPSLTYCTTRRTG